MKKTTLLLSLVVCFAFANAQTVIFNETCGEDGTTGSPRVSVSDYTGWDNKAPVVFSHTTERYADVRQTSTTNSHVWFSANYDTDLIISGIPTVGNTNLKLTFEVACNKAADGNVNKVTLYCNDVEQTVPSVVIEGANTYFSSGEIALPNADVTKLRFLYTKENNPTNFGYRIDNIKIVGTPSGSGIINPSFESPSFYVSGSELVVKNIENGTVVEFYNALGSKVQSAVVDGNAIDMNSLSKGIYIVRAGKYSQKIVF